jgi:hypothetical protein
MIRILRTLGLKSEGKSCFVQQYHISLNTPLGLPSEVEPIGLTDTGNPKSSATPR